MTFNPYPEIRVVSEDIIREAFNSGKFWERAQLGEFTTLTKENIHYTRRQARTRGFQYCSRSQIVRYINEEGTLIAVMHQIRFPDGSLGASGKPDPKYLDLGDVILRLPRLRRR